MDRGRAGRLSVEPVRVVLVARLAFKSESWPGAPMADARCDHRTVLNLALHRGKLLEEILPVLQHALLLSLRGPPALEFVCKLPGVILGVEHEEGGLDRILHVGRHEA